MFQVKVTDSLRQGDKLDGILKVNDIFSTLDLSCPNSNVVLCANFFIRLGLYGNRKKTKDRRDQMLKNKTNFFGRKFNSMSFKPQRN